MKHLFVIIFLCFSTISFSQNWKPITASVTFKIKHALGSSADGSFKNFSGTIIFDPNNLATASMKATVDAKTIDTGLGMRDKEMKDKEYFDVEKYPKISMVSTKFEKGTKPNEYIGYFNLTLKSTTKNIKIPIIFTQNGSQATFKGSFALNRIEYGVGEKSSLLSDTANLTIVVNTQQ